MTTLAVMAITPCAGCGAYSHFRTSLCGGCLVKPVALLQRPALCQPVRLIMEFQTPSTVQIQQVLPPEQKKSLVLKKRTLPLQSGGLGDPSKRRKKKIGDFFVFLPFYGIKKGTLHRLIRCKTPFLSIFSIKMGVFCPPPKPEKPDFRGGVFFSLFSKSEKNGVFLSDCLFWQSDFQF